MSNYKISSNLALSENGFVFSPSTGDSFTLNSTGIMIINLLKADLESSEIVTKMTEEFDVDENTAEKDYQDFINQLKQFNMVEEK